MMTTNSHLRAMTLLLGVILFPTIIASSSMKLDEESVVETESSHLHKRITVPEKRNIRPLREVRDLEVALHIKRTLPPTRPPRLPPKVITLGDSYSSGTGIHRDGDDYDVEYGGNPVLNGVTYYFTDRPDQECWMEKYTTPGPKYASLKGQQSVFYGCKGALISNLNSQLDYLLAALPLDHQHNFQGSTILLTAGGNDIVTNGGKSWPELIRICIKKKDCHDNGNNQIVNFPSVQSGLTSLYNRLATEASGAKIRILGYPKMMQRDPGCGSVGGINKDEADWIDDQIVLLNNRLSAAVNLAKANHPSVDIEFVSVYNYLTVGACGNGASNRHVNDKVLHSFSTKASNSSFHPTQKGYNKYYDALLDSL